MTPKEKAQELIDDFVNDPFTSQITTKGAKRCVEICVEQVLFALKELDWDSDGLHSPDLDNHYKFWQEVDKSLKLI